MPVPGPCSPEGCPPPTEIDCLTVEKVYDSCVQVLTTTQKTAAPECITISSCAIVSDNSSCTVSAITPSSMPDYNIITVTIEVVSQFTCANGLMDDFITYLTPSVTLYNPPGTTPSCNLLSGTCNCLVLPNTEITCTVTVCVLLQTTAYVPLLIPTYGFCSPSACPPTPFPCPPIPLFPPQARPQQ